MRSPKCILLTIVLMISSIDLASAKNLPMTARLFISETKVDPEDLNTELTAQDLKSIDTVSALGIEVTHSAFRFLDWGIRYTRRYTKNEERVDNPNTEYMSELNQELFLLLIRIPLFKSNIFRADVFGGAGGSNTTFRIKSATQEGELIRQKPDDWLATPYSSFGGSAGIGYKNFYLFIETGIETHRVDKLRRTGNLNSNINVIDLSGPYISIGLLFDGLSNSK